MNVKRQYVLPNCNLILEGLEDSDPENVDILDGQSPMSILINAECIFLASNQTISGGSVFLTNLSRAVSNYAQAFLSGLSHPHADSGEYPQVTIDRVDNHLHRLTLIPETNTDEEKTEVNLTTIELFDLVDAIDRFYADRSTLPAMNLQLKPVSRRYRKPEQPIAERLIPVGIGFASLAFAAGALFMIPIPETKPPKTNSLDETTEIDPINTEETLPSTENSPANDTQTDESEDTSAN